MKPVLRPWLIKGVVVIGDHRLRLLFQDGTVGDVSFESREWKGIFEPLCDPARFARVTLEHDSVYWPDDDVDMAPEPLYEAAEAHALTPAVSAA